MTNEACITTGEEDILLSANPEDTSITLSIASDLATTGSHQEVTHGLNTITITLPLTSIS